MSEGFFSRVMLLPATRATDWHRDAMGGGELRRDHAAVWRLFPGDGMVRDFLFRTGVPRGDGAAQYYVVSRRRPVAIPGELEVETKVYRPAFAAGERIAFSLRANPTVSRGERGRRGQRHDVLMNAKRIGKESGKSPDEIQEAIATAAREWLLKRSDAIGLVIDGESLRFDGYRQQVSGRRGGDVQRLSTVDFDGAGTVSDPALLLEALFTGLGHSKGFGCGLLLVRSIP